MGIASSFELCIVEGNTLGCSEAVSLGVSKSFGHRGKIMRYLLRYTSSFVS